MPKYSYLAKSFSGLPKSGVLEAENERELAKILRQEGFLLISAEEEGKTKKSKKINIDIAFLDRISLVEKIMFTRNLKVIVSAGISLPRALNTLSEQAKSKKFKKVLSEVSEQVSRGKSFSDSLANYPSVFSELYVAMIKVGEESGTLENVLDVLINEMEKRHELRSKILGAMAYPMVIIGAMILIGILMLILVVPQLAKTFADLEIQLPLTTRIVVFIGTFFADFWFLLPLIAVAVFFALRLFLKTYFGKRLYDTFILRIPIFSPIIKKTNAAYMVRTLSSLISSGIPIVNALEITSGTLTNVHYKQSIMDSAEGVRKGIKLSQCLEKYKNIYSSLVIQMLTVGEETGQTSDILKKLADFFESEVAQATKNLSVIIEPLLMIVVGAVVGFFVISMLQPMYSMIEAF